MADPAPATPPLAASALAEPPLTAPPLAAQPLTEPALTAPPLTEPPLTEPPLPEPPLAAPPPVRSFDEWRVAARRLLASGVAPENVVWRGADGGGDLLAQAALSADASASADQSLDNVAPPSMDKLAGALAGAPTAPFPAAPARLPRATQASISPGETADLWQTSQVPHARDTAPGEAPRLPRKLVDMLRTAACCRIADRWAFLYRVVWRWWRGDAAVMSAADEDGARLHAMVKAVKREEHDMHAYIRFRERPEAAGAPRFVAWFEPAHDVLPQVARHFVERMGRVSWMIATPDASVLWDGATLHNTGPLLRGAAELDDAGEALWLTYYRSIFNPARVNEGLLQSHIPSRFWQHLPEGAVVPAMISEAHSGARRSGQAEAVGRRSGSTIPIAPEQAQPRRDSPSTLDQCRRCELWQHATQAVGGAGPRDARIMLVGEQPGDQEDLAGAPFVGPAGKLLDQVCEQAGLDRRAIYLTNAVKHFKWEPRGKRRLHKTPAQREVEACGFWLDQEVAQVGPAVIVALGSTALKAVLGNPHATLKDTLGRPIEHGGRWVVTVYHPSYVLRVPDAALKQQAFDVMVDGLKLARQLGGGA
ncbi:MAG: UdgX family uracil-DNA binding protein [Massilia sp.]